MRVRVRRVYEPPEPGDGRRVLVDRVWPRGVARADAAIDEWARDLAPSDGLRRWFAHDPERWEAFRSRYLDELRDRRDRLSELRRAARDEGVTLLFAARDARRNNARVLARALRRGLPSRRG